MVVGRWIAASLTTSVLMLAAGFSLSGAASIAASGQPDATSSNSLTTQFPLGTQTLCCHRTASPPAPGARATTTSTTSSTRATPSTTASQPSSASTSAPSSTAIPASRSNSGHGSGGPPMALVLIGVLLAGLILRFGSPYQRPRERSRKRRGVSGLISGPPWTESLHRDAETPTVRARPSGPAEAIRQPTLRAVAEYSQQDTQPDEAPPAAEEQHPGDPAYRLGIMGYEGGLVDGAAAAWRRAAAIRHPGAASKLDMVSEQRGELQGARGANREAELWGDPNAREHAAPPPESPDG